VGLPAHLAHLHRHRQGADEAAAATNLCQQQAIKQLGFTTHRPQKTTLIRIIWEAAKWVALSYNVLQASISNKNSNFAQSAQKCSMSSEVALKYIPWK